MEAETEEIVQTLLWPSLQFIVFTFIVLDKKKKNVQEKTTKKRSKQDTFGTDQRTLTPDEDYKKESVLDVPLSKVGWLSSHGQNMLTLLSCLTFG